MRVGYMGAADCADVADATGIVVVVTVRTVRCCATGDDSGRGCWNEKAVDAAAGPAVLLWRLGNGKDGTALVIGCVVLCCDVVLDVDDAVPLFVVGVVDACPPSVWMP